MNNKVHYKSISLRNNTYNKLDVLSKKLVQGYSLSKPKTIELLINHYIDKFSSVESNKNGDQNNGNAKEVQEI